MAIPFSRPFSAWRPLFPSAAVIIFAVVFPHDGSLAADVFPGPVMARVLKVIDGDTFTAQALIWPGQMLTVNVRLRGVDAPELRARCEQERAAAMRATAALEHLIQSAAPVAISNIASDKYYGRVVADVTTGAGDRVAQRLLDADLVRPYAGGGRAGWC